MKELSLIVAVGVASWIGTGLVRAVALRRAWLDIPNERSSHTVPTPRGGGVAVVATVFLAVGIAAWAGWVPTRLAVALLGGGIPVAAIGWLDDRRGVRPGIRFAVHLAAAVLAVVQLGGFGELRVGTSVVSLGPMGSLIAVIFVAWLINLYNFMDGIDGIAGAEALCVGAIAALCSARQPAIAIVALVLAAASTGFLVWNWQPAKIFLGDAGSGVIGYVLGVLALASEREGGIPLVLWVVLLGAFIFDATATLLRRMLRREPWYAAHRSHAYQRLVTAGWSHWQVVAALIGVNAVLGVLIYAATRVPELTVATLVAAALILAALYLTIERRSPMATSASGPR